MILRWIRRRWTIWRAGRQNIRDLWTALRMVRECVELNAPPGSVQSDEYLAPEPCYEADAIIEGILAITAQRNAYKDRCGELSVELCQMRERAERAEGSPHHEIVGHRRPTDASCKICGGNCGQCGGPLG